MYLLIEKSFELNQAWNLQSDVVVVVIEITITRKGDLIMLVTTSISQLVSSKCPRSSQNCAKVYEFVPAMGSEPNFPRIVHCSDTVCSLLVHLYLFTSTNKYK